MIAKFHNWKNKLFTWGVVHQKKILFSSVFLMLVLGCLFIPNLVNAVPSPGDIIDSMGAAIKGGMLSLVNVILYYIFIVPIFWLIAIVMWVLTTVAGFQTFINEPSVIAGWTIARDLVNVGLITVLLYIAFGTIISYNKVDWQKDLLKLVMVAVAVNFSRMIVGLLIDLSQVIMLTFVNGFRNIASGNVTGRLGLNYYLDGTKEFSFDPEVAGRNFVKITLGIIMGVLLLAILSMMTAWLIVRIVKLWLLTILAPFYFLALFFPFLKRFETYWKDQMTEQLVAGPFMAFGIWFAMSVMSQTGKPGAITTPSGNMSDGNAFTGNADDVAKQSNNLFTMMIGAGLLYGVFDMSKSMSSTAAMVGSAIVDRGKGMMMAGATGAIGLAKKGVAGAAQGTDWLLSQATRRTLGRDISYRGAKNLWAGPGGIKDTVRTKFEALETSASIAASGIRERKRDEAMEANPEYMAANVELARGEQNLKKLDAERRATLDPAAALIGDLKGRADRGSAATREHTAINSAFEKAKSGDYSALQALANDPSYNFSSDMRKKLASASQKMGLGTKAVNDLKNNNYDTSNPEVMKNLLAAGVLSQSDLDRLKGRASGELMPADIFAKIDGFSKFGGASLDSMDSVIEEAKNNGFDVSANGFDVFADLAKMQQEKSVLMTDGTNAGAVLGEWEAGKYQQDPELAKQQAALLGLRPEQVSLLTGQSKGDWDKKIQDNAKEKARSTGLVEKARQQMQKVQLDTMNAFSKSIFTRSREARIASGMGALNKSMELRHPLHKTPDGLAQVFATNGDPEERNWAISQLGSNNMLQFMRHSQVPQDSSGLYELIFKIGNESNELNNVQKSLLDNLRNNGGLSPEEDEAFVKQLELATGDTFKREMVQHLLTAAEGQIPNAGYLGHFDGATGRYQFTSVADRRRIEFDELNRNNISKDKYDGFTYLDNRGEYQLQENGVLNALFRSNDLVSDYGRYAGNPSYLQTVVRDLEKLKQTAADYRDKMLVGADPDRIKQIVTNYETTIKNLDTLATKVTSQVSTGGRNPVEEAISSWTSR